MQSYTDLLWLNTRLEKVKLYFDHLKSHLTHLEPKYEDLRPHFQDVERQFECVRPWIDDFRPSFRGLEPRARKIRSLMQRVLVCSLIVLFIGSWWNFLQRGGFLVVSASRSPKSDNSVFNTTLGVCLPAVTSYWEDLADRREKFQKVFALALPDRRDRIQPLTDAANATNINITVLDAVRDRQIPEDAWPKGWSDHPAKNVGELGCLMSHVRTWKKMIAENIESALILESDADWDLRIKQSLEGVATASKRLLDWPFDVPTRPGMFPYGDKWDIIWLGHCGIWNPDNHRIYSFNDSSVPPEDFEYTFTQMPKEGQHRPGTRSVFPLGFATCSTAYAISNAGAVKLEKEFRHGSDNIDLRLAQICRESQEVSCLGVWPQLITAAITETNIEHPLGEIAFENPMSDWFPGPALQYSARLNAEKVFNGSGMDEWNPQWNSTWAMKNETWTKVGFDEAKTLEAKTDPDGEEKKEKKGETKLWQWYNGKYAGSRSFG